MRFTRKQGGFVGRRIELATHLDLWMRGARFGEIVMQSTAHKPGEMMRLKVRMDHPQVKRLAVIHVADIGKFVEGGEVYAGWGLVCPACGDDSHLDITATTSVRLTRDGTDADAAADRSHDWTPESKCVCTSCRHAGTVKAFTFAPGA